MIRSLVGFILGVLLGTVVFVALVAVFRVVEAVAP